MTAAGWEPQQLPMPGEVIPMPVLRRRAVVDALYRIWTQRAADGITSSVREHCEALATEVVQLARAEHVVKAEALREAAAEQRQMAAASRTNGRAEHEDIADWLDACADTVLAEGGAS